MKGSDKIHQLQKPYLGGLAAAISIREGARAPCRAAMHLTVTDYKARSKPYWCKPAAKCCLLWVTIGQYAITEISFFG